MSRNGIFSLPFHVRDYECDTGGGVNNASYLHYFEHARFQFMREHLGWSVDFLSENKIGFVVASLNVEFRRSLMPNDHFVVESQMTRIAIRRFLFDQEIYLVPKDKGASQAPRKPYVTAKVVCASINTETGRAEASPRLESLLMDFPVSVPEKE